MPPRSPRTARLVVLARALAAALMASAAPGLPGTVRAEEASPASKQAVAGLQAPRCRLAARSAAGGFEASRERRFEGHMVLVDFWASWCPTCEHAFPFLDALARDYREHGLEVIAVNLDADPADALAFLAGRDVAFEVVRDPNGSCPRAFGLVGMPSSYLIDAQGRVLEVTRGFRRGEARALRERIETLLVKAPADAADPALARVSSPPPP